MNQTDRQMSVRSLALGTLSDPMNVALVEVEQFLYAEAALLDELKFEEWLTLLTEDARYEVPAIDRPAGDPANKVALVSDNLFRLRARLMQITGGYVLGESPTPSRTRRMISNVRILGVEGDVIRVADNFAIYRFRHERVETFVGSHEHTQVVVDGALRIRLRRSTLDHEALRPHGKLTIVL